MIPQLELPRLLPPQLRPNPPLPHLAHTPEIKRPHQRRHQKLHLRQRQTPPNTSPRTSREGIKRALRNLHILARRALLLDQPALGLELERLRVVVRVVVDAVDAGADVAAGRDVQAVDLGAGRVDFAPERAADGGGDAHGLVDAGAEIGAGGEACAHHDFVCRFEG